MDNAKKSQIANRSRSTGSSTGRSTPGSTALQRVGLKKETVRGTAVKPYIGLVPDMRGKYKRKEIITWTAEETKKLLSKSMRSKIFKYFNPAETKNPKPEKMKLKQDGLLFFEKEFPKRSRLAVYQKAWRIKNRKGRKILVIFK